MKTRKIPSALPIYMAAAVWLIFNLIHPVYTLPALILCALLSAGAFFGGRIIFPGREEQVEEEPNSGDPEVDRQIKEGRADMKKLREANVALTDPEITRQLDRMEHASSKIFEALEKNPRQALNVRKFMNYYLPTTVKLLEQYRTLAGTGIDSENIAKSKTAVENSLQMISDAYEKQLDNLYHDTSLDITTDIQVLETMMASEGLTDTAATMSSLSGRG